MLRKIINCVIWTILFNAKVRAECVIAETTVNGRSVCQGELIFEDNFDAIDRAKWQHVFQLSSEKKDADFAYFEKCPGCLFITDGNLCIRPLLLEETRGFDAARIRSGELLMGNEHDSKKYTYNCTGFAEEECYRRAGGAYGGFRILPPVKASKIRTRDTFSFRYGRVEIRAKLPKGDWLFPLITLEPTANYYGESGYNSGQIRIAFTRGNIDLVTSNGEDISGKKLSGGVVLDSSSEHRTAWTVSRTADEHWGNDFHIFGVKWTPKTLMFTVDRSAYGKIAANSIKSAYSTHNVQSGYSWFLGSTMAPFDKEFYISLGVSAGGNSDFPDGCLNGRSRYEKPWANLCPRGELNFWKDRRNWRPTWKEDDSSLMVDYIRVYAV